MILVTKTTKTLHVAVSVVDRFIGVGSPLYFYTINTKHKTT